MEIILLTNCLFTSHSWIYWWELWHDQWPQSHHFIPTGSRFSESRNQIPIPCNPHVWQCNLTILSDVIATYEEPKVIGSVGEPAAFTRSILRRVVMVFYVGLNVHNHLWYIGIHRNIETYHGSVYIQYKHWDGETVGGINTMRRRLLMSRCCLWWGGSSGEWLRKEKRGSTIWIILTIVDGREVGHCKKECHRNSWQRRSDLDGFYTCPPRGSDFSKTVDTALSWANQFRLLPFWGYLRSAVKAGYVM